jgi:hypothetical protein
LCTLFVCTKIALKRGSLTLQSIKIIHFEACTNQSISHQSHPTNQ